MFLLIASFFGLKAQAEEPSGTYKGSETPSYQVSEKQGATEIRDYGSSLVAEVDVKGSRETAVNTGFRILAGYIFGSNETKESIKMTAPVTQSGQSTKISMTTPVTQAPSQSENGWTVQFTMPKKYTLDTLPTAKNERIRFLVSEPYRAVAIRFSGIANDAEIARQTERLRSFASEQKLTLVGEPKIAYYDDPFTLPWFRRNEVLFKVK